MRQFAEEEIVLTTGPHAGRKFRIARQPLAGLLLDEMDSERWRRFVVTGPAQSGKTLCGFVIPVLYHLFEVGETVICGLPSMDLAADKWRDDLRPAIEASGYRELLPSGRAGAGSRGGKSGLAIQFRNGRVLRFMSGGGADKSRAGMTSRVVVISETDGMDTAGGGSREADPIAQLEARTQAFGSRARIYLECTVSTETGRTWQDYMRGSHSRLALPCPHCGAWVTPEREHLVGWRDVENVMDAGAQAAIVCSGCGVQWTEGERFDANRQAMLLHEGLEVEGGQIRGQAKRTDTLGFRWTAVNNLLISMSDVARKEWWASRQDDADAAEKDLRQFTWALPWAPAAIDLTATDWRTIC